MLHLILLHWLMPLLFAPKSTTPLRPDPPLLAQD